MEGRGGNSVRLVAIHSHDYAEKQNWKIKGYTGDEMSRKV